MIKLFLYVSCVSCAINIMLGIRMILVGEEIEQYVGLNQATLWGLILVFCHYYLLREK